MEGDRRQNARKQRDMRIASERHVTIIEPPKRDALIRESRMESLRYFEPAKTRRMREEFTYDEALNVWFNDGGGKRMVYTGESEEDMWSTLSTMYAMHVGTLERKYSLSEEYISKRPIRKE